MTAWNILSPRIGPVSGEEMSLNGGAFGPLILYIGPPDGTFLKDTLDEPACIRRQMERGASAPGPRNA